MADNMGDEIQAIIFDLGGGITKAGFAGDDTPKTIFPSVVGRPLPENAQMFSESTFVGDDAFSKQGLLSLEYPATGTTTNWEAVQQVWRHTFKNLQVSPAEHPILYAQSPIATNDEKQKIVEMGFETFHTPAMFLAPDGLLSIYGGGRSNGISLDVGHSGYSLFTVYDGHALPQAVKRVDFGGSGLTDYLTKLLNQKGHSFTSTWDREIVSQMKEKHALVADSNQEYLSKYSQQHNTIEYQIPTTRDSINLEVCDLYSIGEALFTPSLVERPDIQGIHEAVFDTIQQTPVDCRKTLYDVIYVSGGTSFLSGFVKRLEDEIKKLAPPSVRTRCIAHPERNYLAWLGGSILASMSDFQARWISKQDYEEQGSSVVHAKSLLS